MGHQFKPGDLALTLCAKKAYPAMCVVELIAFVLASKIYETGTGQIWTPPKNGWVVDRAESDTHDFYEPHELMPLYGDFAPEQQARKTQPCA
jgi:hypothetical protein